MFNYVKKRYKENLLLLFIIVSSVVIKIKSAFLTAEAFNSLLSGNTNAFIFKVTLCATFYFIYTLLLAFQTWYETFVRQRMLADLRRDIIKSYAANSPNKAIKYTSGKITSWLTTDINRIDNEGYKNLYNITEALIDVTFSIVALYSINWMLMLCIVVLAIVNLVLPKLVDRKIAETFKELTIQQETFTSNVGNYLEGFLSLFSINKQSFLVSKLDKEIKNMCNSEISSYKIIGVATFFAAFGNVLGQIGSLIISGLFVARKLLTFGDILSVSTISVSVFNGVSNLSSKIIQIKGVFPIFEKQLTFSNLVKEELLEENQKISNITFTSQLELMNVNLTFNGYNIFSDTNYRFKKGGRYCIIGPSGTGKSTLFKLLNGSLNYDSGEIELDGQSITKIKGKALRSQITYVEQTPYIFNTTLRENIVLDGQFSDKEINDAIDIVGLSEEVNRLGEGIDTWIGDGQLTLSGGQKQRLALARAILNGSHFLLLDESTSSLNIQLAQIIEKKLLTRSDYSIIFITHHLSEEMKVFFDDILELRDGKLISQK